jgi:uroporphyrinogen decarboxylase
MDRRQWQRLLQVVENRKSLDVAVALIVDSPWLPSLEGCTTLEYLVHQERWLNANLLAFKRFPDIIFLPGAWVEFGLAIEPSAFGGILKWWRTQPPSILPVVSDTAQIARMSPPNPENDGLMPVALEMQRWAEPILNSHGHGSKIVAARGPLAIASQLRGVTDLLIDIKVEPQAAKALIEICTQTSIGWLRAQADNLPDVEAIQVHDDIVGMLSPVDYEEFAHPYLERVFRAFPNYLHIYHNDTPGIRFFDRFADAGAQVLNYSHLSSTAELDALIGNRVCLMGNIAPMEVLMHGTGDSVRRSSQACIESSNRGFLLSAGGGMSPEVKPEQLDIMVQVARESLAAGPVATSG